MFVINCHFRANKTPVEVIKEGRLEERRFRGKLVKMFKDAESKFEDYSILCIGVMN